MAEELKKEAFLDQLQALCPTVDNLRLMLGEARNVLAMQPLTRFCLKEDQDIYSEIMRQHWSPRLKKGSGTFHRGFNPEKAPLSPPIVLP